MGQSPNRCAQFAALLATLTAGLFAGCAAPPPLPDALYQRRPELAAVDRSGLAGRRILIDPGHGGRFSGSVGADSTREADVNLGVALYLWGLLRDAGADVHLTRSSDRDLLPAAGQALADDLGRRVALIDSLKPEVFLSLHHNSNAALDRERNAVETYFKLDDNGPSYELARAIHARLAASLGIRRAEIRPGNYFVLRHAAVAAVLGEASYLSNPRVENRLQLAEKQLLEAEAYFLGLADYFARGVPRIRRLDSAGDTLRVGERLVFELRDERSSIDPTNVRLLLNNQVLPAVYDSQTGRLELTVDERLPAGTYWLQVQARNSQGQSAIPLQQKLHVFAPVANVELLQAPPIAAPGSDVRLTLFLWDAWHRPVADGLPVMVRLTGGKILGSESTCRDGTLLVLLRLDAKPSLRPVLDVRAGQRDFALPLQIGEAPEQRFVRLLHSGFPVADAQVVCEGVLERSDRAGFVAVAGRGSLRIDCAGYVPYRGEQAPQIELQPLFAGVLHGRHFLLDPAGDPRAPTHPQFGVSPAQRAFDLTRLLSGFLESCGAHVVLSRGLSEAVPVSERARLALASGSEWYVQIETPLEPRQAEVLHYPQSEAGARLAASVGRALEPEVAPGIRIRSDTSTILQQTPCPAVSVLLPGLATADQAALRKAAYAVFVGILNTVGVVEQQALQCRVVPADASPQLLLLDGAIALAPEADGSVRFECVGPGTHYVTLLGNDLAHEFEVIGDPKGQDKAVDFPWPPP